MLIAASSLLPLCSNQQHVASATKFSSFFNEKLLTFHRNDRVNCQRAPITNQYLEFILTRPSTSWITSKRRRFFPNPTGHQRVIPTDESFARRINHGLRFTLTIEIKQIDQLNLTIKNGLTRLLMLWRIMNASLFYDCYYYYDFFLAGAHKN